MYTRAVSGTQNGAKIMGVFDFIQQKQKRRFSLGFCRCQDIRNLCIRKRCRLCNYPLMLYPGCKLVQLSFVHMLNHNSRFARFGNNGCGQMLLRRFGDPNLIECTAGTKRFKH
ncbi:hypothetical protein D3C75_575120 [compost metagenome]